MTPEQLAKVRDAIATLERAHARLGKPFDNSDSLSPQDDFAWKVGYAEGAIEHALQSLISLESLV